MVRTRDTQSQTEGNLNRTTKVPRRHDYLLPSPISSIVALDCFNLCKWLFVMAP
jgi:hypothetical protein